MNSGDYVWLMSYSMTGDFVRPAYGSDVFSSRGKALAAARKAIRKLLCPDLVDESIVDKEMKSGITRLPFGLKEAYGYEYKDSVRGFLITACAERVKVK